MSINTSPHAPIVTRTIPKVNPTRHLYPSPLPFAPLTAVELDYRQRAEEGRTVVAAANALGDRPVTEGAAMDATHHANLSMAFCEAYLVRAGRCYVPLAVTQ